jgi:hypothetical protein
MTGMNVSGVISNRRTIVKLTLLCVLTFVSRYLFKANYLYEWDSVQFGLSILKFDILWHQPHPPGYILYVIAIKAVHLFFHDINNSIILTNILFSIVTLLLFHKLCDLFFKDEHTAFMASILLAADPVFWFNGSTATIYTLDAFITVTAG